MLFQCSWPVISLHNSFIACSQWSRQATSASAENDFERKTKSLPSLEINSYGLSIKENKPSAAHCIAGNMPNITLCRFMDDGSLESFESDLDDSRYIAISHVWSRAQWTKIPGIPFEVLVSPHKARYIMKRLPALVRNLPFWMDVLCVDQKSKAARIAVVNSIPEIYRQASHTLSIKDGDGIRDCCLRSISTFSDWSRHGSTELLNHIAKKHFADGLTETYLDRVWPLEEAFLSDVIQFDMCEENQPERPSYHSGDYMLRASVDAQRIIASIHSLGYTWIGHGVDGRQASESRFEEFVKAFITNGVMSRPPAASKPLEVSSRDNLLYQLHLNSTRKTGKPRDFVFAIMSKYEWYTVPARGGDMTFPELFLIATNKHAGLVWDSIASSYHHSGKPRKAWIAGYPALRYRPHKLWGTS